MTTSQRALLVLAGLGLALAACHSPTHTGGGEIQAVNLRPDLSPIGLYVSPKEEFFVVQTAAPQNINVVYTGRMVQEKLRVIDYQDLCFDYVQGVAVRALDEVFIGAEGAVELASLAGDAGVAATDL